MLVRGEFALGCEWLDAFLARDEAAEVDPGLRGEALIGRAQLTLATDPAAAGPLARAGLELCRAADDDFWTAAGLNLLSEIAVHTGRPDEAETLGREAIAIAEAAGDKWNEGWALSIRASVAGLHGRVREAAELANSSIGVMRGIDHRWGVARAQLGLGDLARTRGDHADARQRYTEALVYLREIDARPEIARCLSGLGRLATDLGATALAREHLTESLRLSRTIGTRIGVARGLESFAALALREGEPEQAVLLTAASTALREAGGLPPLPGARAERYLVPARRLGDQVVARLWARGLALSAEAAVDLALEPPAAPTVGPENAADATARTPPSSLTPRELEVAALVAAGRSNKAIAEELVISPATAARHIANIMVKLGFRSRAQIAAWTVDRGSALPLLGAGFFDGQLRRRVRFQSLVGDRLPAEHGPAVRPGLQAGQRPVNRVQPGLQVRCHGLIILLEGQRQRRVPVVTGLICRPQFGIGSLFSFGLLQQRGHLGALREQQFSRPAFVHVRSLMKAPPRAVARLPDGLARGPRHLPQRAHLTQSACPLPEPQPEGPFRPRLKSWGRITSAGTRSCTDGRPSASSAESMPVRSTSKTFRTPDGPAAARPHRQGRPIITARAPRASAFTTSPPRRTPPSSSTSARPATASTTPGRARIEAGVPSRLLPPWLDTEIAVAPAPTARRASAARITPLTMNGPPHRSRSQAMSSQAGGGTVAHER
jgi:DNA-binding CsgD family transcriptional regulator